MVKTCGWGDPGDLQAAGVLVVPGFGKEIADKRLVGVGKIDLDTSEARAPVQLAARFRPVCGCGADPVFIEHGA